MSQAQTKEIEIDITELPIARRSHCLQRMMAMMQALVQDIEEGDQMLCVARDLHTYVMADIEPEAKNIRITTQNAFVYDASLWFPKHRSVAQGVAEYLNARHAEIDDYPAEADPYTVQPVMPLLREAMTSMVCYGLAADAAMQHFRLGEKSYHGVMHWDNVFYWARMLYAGGLGIDMQVVEAFCAWHDVARIDEGFDPDHGPRAARLVTDASGLTEEQMTQLRWAISEHSAGGTTDDVTVGTCWDADRCDLSRINVTPRESYMSTNAGKRYARYLQTMDEDSPGVDTEG